ncbi:MAG: hypothetical protein ABI697_13565 [Devosia sp.]
MALRGSAIVYGRATAGLIVEIRHLDSKLRGEDALKALTAAQVAVKLYLELDLAELERRADGGDTIAMIARGDACLGAKVAVSRSEYFGNLPAAGVWFQRAYDSDHSIVAIHRLALTYIHRNYVRRAVDLYEEAASMGCCCAAYLAAVHRAREQWASQSEVRGLFERAVALGDIAARARLANMLLYGKGGPCRPWRALRLLVSMMRELKSLKEDDPRLLALN